MSFATITSAQRADLIRAAQRVVQSGHRATQDYTTKPITDAHVRDGEYVQIDALLAELKALVDAAVA